MDQTYRCSRVESDGRRLIDVAVRDFSASVPTCPGWDAEELLRHASRVWRIIGSVVSTVADSMVDVDQLEMPPDGPEGLEDFARAVLDELVAALRAADPAAPVWTWVEEQKMSVWIRRAHQETLVHRVDAEAALDDHTPVPPEDGIDGVDELFSVIAPIRASELPTGSMHLHQTDGDGEFMLKVVDGSITVTREHAKGDAALRASGEDLLLVVWGRRDLDGLEFFGDAAVAASWIGVAP